MAIIPQYQPQVQVNPSAPAQLPQFDQAPESAFGGGLANAAERAGKTAQRIGDVLGAEVTEEQKLQNKQDVLNAETEFRQKLQDRLYNPEQDANGVSKGFLNRQGDQAKGLTKDFDSITQEMIQNGADGLSTGHMKYAFAELARNASTSARAGVEAHEAAQRKAGLLASNDAHGQQQVNDAALLRNGQELMDAMGKAQKKQSNFLQSIGTDPDTINLKNQNLLGEMAKKNIYGILDKDWSAAQIRFDTVKNKIPPSSWAEIQGAINGKKFTEEVANLTNQNLNHKLADGKSFDLDAVKDNIMGRDDGTPFDTKLKQFNAVASNLKEIEADTTRKDASNFHDFSNKVVDAWKEGAKKADMIGMITKYPFDPVMQKKAQDYVEQIFNPKNQHNDPETYNILQKRLRDNDPTLKPSEIIQANLDGNLSDATTNASLDKLAQRQTGIDQAADKNAWKIAENQIKRIDGYDKDARKFNEMLAQMHETWSTRNPGKTPTPAETQELFNELNGEPAKKSVPAGWFGKSSQLKPWQQRANERQDSNSALGLVHKAIGSTNARLMGNDITDINRFKDFVAPTQDISYFSAGNPGGLAIKALVDRGDDVNPENVKAYLEYTHGTGTLDRNLSEAGKQLDKMSQQYRGK